MRTGQIDSVFKIAAFELYFTGNFDVSEVKPIGDNRVSDPEAAMVDIGAILDEEPFDKGCADYAVGGCRGIGCEVDQAPIGNIFGDEFLRGAFRMEFGGVGEDRDGDKDG